MLVFFIMLVLALSLMFNIEIVCAKNGFIAACFKTITFNRSTLKNSTEQ